MYWTTVSPQRGKQGRGGVEREVDVRRFVCGDTGARGQVDF